jgi:hypothetical protein
MRLCNNASGVLLDTGGKCTVDPAEEPVERADGEEPVNSIDEGPHCARTVF